MWWCAVGCGGGVLGGGVRVVHIQTRRRLLAGACGGVVLCICRLGRVLAGPACAPCRGGGVSAAWRGVRGRRCGQYVGSPLRSMANALHGREHALPLSRTPAHTRRGVPERSGSACAPGEAAVCASAVLEANICGPGQRLECQSTLTGLLTGLLTGPGADRPELLAAVCGSGLALSRAWGQRGSVTNSSFSFNPDKINTHTAYMCWRLLVFEQVSR